MPLTARRNARRAIVRWLDRPRVRLVVSVVAGAFALALLSTTIGEWPDRYPVAATALGLLVAVLAGAYGGLFAGAIVGLAGWAANAIVVADGSLEAVLAGPAWVAAGTAAGWLASRLRRSTRADSELAGVRRLADEAIIGIDADGTIASWTTAAAAIYRYHESEIVGHPVADLFKGADAEERARRLLEAIERGDEVLEDTQRRRDGTAFDASLSLARVPGGRAIVVVRDLTELRESTRRAQDADAKYAALANHLPLATYTAPPDADATPTFVSPQIERLTGFSVDEWLRDPELPSRLVHPDDRERVQSERAEARDEQRPLFLEYRLLARDGRTVWIREEAVVVRDGHGEPLCVQGYLLDVTERKSSEEDRKQLRAAETAAIAAARDRQQKAEFLATSGAILSSSLEYAKTIREVASVAVRGLADWCVVELLSDDGALTRIASEHSETADARFAPGTEPELGAASVIQQHRPVVSADRIAVPLVSHSRRTLGALTLIADPHRRPFTSDDLSWANALAGMAALAIETSRLHAEVEARAEATRVLTYVGDGVFLLDRDGIVRLWNPAAEAITGLAAGQVVGRRAEEAIPDWEQIAERVPVAAAGEPAIAEALPVETQRGERWISISGVEFFGGTVHAFRDITDAHRLDELQAEFIATASHELRTPLAAVYGAAQTLRRHDFALDESGRERFITLIVDESERLGRIVNQILLANQLDVGRVDLLTEPFDAAELIERVAEAARTHTPPHLELAIALKRVPPVAADKDRVRQILVNLVENAIKYSPDGGTIELGVEAADGHVQFRVLDEGLGIPPEEQPHVFEKFYRLDPDMTRGIGGTGLGLYICSELVERMGGRIWVESRQPKGSAFYFELPSAGGLRATPRLREAAAAERPA